jgi:hypothetical protein
MPKQCLFCDNRANTKEHLWPDWALKGIERVRPIHQVVSKFGKEEPREFHGDVRIKCVCSECNNGWMSDLEQSVRSVIGAMVHDISLTLDAETQATVSRWVAKTAMVLEAATPVAERFYSREECRELRIKGTIPDRSMIWLGRISEVGVFAAGTRVWMTIDPGDKTKSPGCVATFSVGYFVTQILTIRFPKDLTATQMNIQCFDGPWGESLVTCHPATRRVSWPPPITFHTQREPLFAQLRDRWKVGRPL